MSAERSFDCIVHGFRPESELQDKDKDKDIILPTERASQEHTVCYIGTPLSCREAIGLLLKHVTRHQYLEPVPCICALHEATSTVMHLIT